jgi:PAS domain S-box-containing protein
MVLVSELRRYGLAAISCGLALAVAWPSDAPTSCFFLAAMVSSLYGGKGPGLMSVALSALAYDYFFLPPRFHLAIEPSSYVQFAVFLTAILLIVGLVEAKRRVGGPRRQVAARVQRSEYYLAEAERLGHIGSYASNARVNPPEIRYISAEMYRILGFPAGDVPPTTEEAGKVFTAAGPENWPRIMELYETARREKIADGEFPAVLPDGSNRMIRIVAHTVYDAAGEPDEFIGTCVDVTDQHRARTELQKAVDEIRKSENQLRAIINTIPAFAWSARPDGSADFFNQLYLDYTGLSAEQAMDRGWTVAVHPDDLNGLADYWRSVLASGEAGEVEARLRRFDGTYRWFLFRTSPLHDESGNIVKWYGINADIEDRKLAQDALRTSERDLSLIIEAIPSLVWCADPDGEVNYLNGRMLEYTGTTPGSWEQFGWTNFLHPDDVEPTARAWSRAIATGETHEIQCRLRRSDGVYRWFQVLGHPTRNNEGGVTRWYGLLIDIDDRKNMEEALRNSETRLSRAAQTATLGELSASIAHEINQPLAAALTNSQVCIGWLSAQPPNVAKAIAAGERAVCTVKDAGEVVRRIRALFKGATVENVALDLNEVIDEVLRLIHGEAARRRVEVEADLQPEIPSLVGDRVQLQQLIRNLLLNGLEAMDQVMDRPKKLLIRSRRHSPEFVLVEIQDHGVGLKEPDKVFDAFYTTKESGMGMGLAICRSIVEAHHGRLWAASGEEYGAVFCFTLPARPLGRQI